MKAINGAYSVSNENFILASSKRANSVSVLPHLIINLRLLLNNLIDMDLPFYLTSKFITKTYDVM